MSLRTGSRSKFSRPRLLIQLLIFYRNAFLFRISSTGCSRSHTSISRFSLLFVTRRGGGLLEWCRFCSCSYWSLNSKHTRSNASLCLFVTGSLIISWLIRQMNRGGIMRCWLLRGAVTSITISSFVRARCSFSVTIGVSLRLLYLSSWADNSLLLVTLFLNLMHTRITITSKIKLAMVRPTASQISPAFESPPSFSDSGGSGGGM